jgi:putative DNA primase/helicase
LHEATKGYDFNRVLTALENGGALAKKEPGKKSANHRIPSGGTERLYWIDPIKLEME